MSCKDSMSLRLTKKERLRKRSDFQRVFRSSKQVSCRGLKLLYCKNETTWNRCAFVCSKAQGNAVRRNREKRVAREIYRSRKDRLKSGFDLIVILLSGEYGYADRQKQFDTLVRDANLTLQI